MGQQCGLDNDFIQNGLKALFDESVNPDMQLLQSVKSMSSTWDPMANFCPHR
jgi:hypothetical protein